MAEKNLVLQVVSKEQVYLSPSEILVFALPQFYTGNGREKDVGTKFS